MLKSSFFFSSLLISSPIFVLHISFIIILLHFTHVNVRWEVWIISFFLYHTLLLHLNISVIWCIFTSSFLKKCWSKCLPYHDNSHLCKFVSSLSFKILCKKWKKKRWYDSRGWMTFTWVIDGLKKTNSVITAQIYHAYWN